MIGRVFKMFFQNNNSRVSLDASIERYNRQMISENWDENKQEKLYNSSVLLIGDSLLGQMTLGCFAALGIGQIVLMNKSSKSKKGFLDNGTRKGLRQERIIQTAKKINPYIDISGFNSNFSKSTLSYKNFKPDFIVDTSNNLESKEKVLDYSIKNKIRLISSYCNHKKSILSIYDNKNNDLENILDSEKILNESIDQGTITSGFNAGIITDELRKFIFNLNDRDENIEKKIYYNLDSTKRFIIDSDIDKKIQGISNKKALVVGAGAIGNYVALNLANSGFKNIDILDYDTIEDTNLNRQILFYDKVGERKSQTLCERIKSLGKIRSRSFCYKIDENSKEFFEKNKYDVIFGCLDNFRARYFLSEYCKDFKTTLIDGGTSDMSGSLAIYSPGKTPCIKCKKNLKLDSEVKRSCGQALPSVVIPNIIVGSLMVGESMNIFRSEILNKRIVYDSFNKSRLYLQDELNSKKNCNCLN
jgi:molybdopterin/thiamine biosynthesis adenylyltransferase